MDYTVGLGPFCSRTQCVCDHGNSRRLERRALIYPDMGWGGGGKGVYCNLVVGKKRVNF